ncbi:STAS domain-containing protein [Streptomyces sp. NPDC054794]
MVLLGCGRRDAARLTAFFRQWEPTVMGFDPTAVHPVQQFFDLQISHLPGRVVMAVAGELDFTTCSQTAPVIASLAIAGQDLTLDMTRVTFMDASGLGMLMRLRQRVVTGGGGVELRSVQPQVWRVLELTGTDAQFRETVLPALPGT